MKPNLSKAHQTVAFKARAPSRGEIQLGGWRSQSIALAFSQELTSLALINIEQEFITRDVKSEINRCGYVADR